ncbi:hypothetical protein HD806DRAFT_178460 [Xylariaceae sp. AK1471]|nr:hypothetical protein HD806DRAFT_178460 [Xylariaceae sp. AK1471]
MGLGTKLKEALNGDKDRKDTSHSTHQNAPGAYPSDEVPRSHQESVNEGWYAPEPRSGQDINTNEPTALDSGYTYSHDLPVDGVDAEAPRKTGLRKPAPTQSTHHRKTGSKDSTHAYEEEGRRPAPYWGDTPTQKKDHGPAVHGGNDTFDLYNDDGGHEQLHGRPRDERRKMNGQDGYVYPAPQANGINAPGVDPAYAVIDRTRRSADIGPGGMAAGAGSSIGTSMGSKGGMGDDHYGPGHPGAKVLHRCENCGVDNDISRYFKKDVAYRME